MEEAARRADMRDRGAADRIGGRNTEYHIAVAANFTSLAMEDSDRFRLIDALGDTDAVTERLLAAVEDL
jgi:dTMP kinase